MEMLTSPIAKAMINSALLPAAGVVVAFFLISLMSDTYRRQLQSLALAIGLMAGVYALVGRLGIPPKDVSESIGWLGVVSAIFVMLSPQAAGGRYGLRAVFVLLMGGLLLWHIRGSVFVPAHYRNLVAFFCLALGVWSIVERSAARVSLVALLAMGSLATAFLSFVLLLKGSASMSQLATSLAVQLGALAVLALVAPRRVDALAVLPFLSVLPVLYMAAGHFYLDINPWHMIYLCFPFLLLWVRRAFSFIPNSPIGETLMLTVMAGAPLGYFVWTLFKSAGPLY